MINNGSNKARLKWALPLFAAVLAVPASLAMFPQSAVSTAIAQGSDALKQFVDRSPGTRGATAPLKGKGKGTAMALGEKVAPEQRALGKVFDTPPEEDIEQLAQGPAGPQAIPGVARPISDIASSPASAALPAPATSGFGAPGGLIIPIGGSSSGGSSGAVASSSGGGGSSSGGGSSGGGSSGGSTGGGTSSGGSSSGGVVPAVPEPGTWLMMILGFGAIGAAMRRRKPGVGSTDRAIRARGQ